MRLPTVVTVKKTALTIVTILMLVTSMGCIEEEDPPDLPTFYFDNPHVFRIKEVGNETLVDLFFLLLKCIPTDSKVLKDRVSIDITDADGKMIIEDARMQDFSGAVPVAGFNIYYYDNSSEYRYFEANDTMYLTGLDSRFLGGTVYIKSDVHVGRPLAEIRLPLNFVYVYWEDVSMDHSGPLSLANISIDNVKFQFQPMRWEDVDIRLRHHENFILDRRLVPRPYDGHYGEDVAAWYVDNGTNNSIVDAGDALIISGLTSDYYYAKVLIRFNGEPFFSVLRFRPWLPG